MKKNFVFIGAGSSVFTMNLVCDLILGSDAIDIGEIRLVDIEPVILDKVHTVISKIFSDLNMSVTVKKFTDYKQSLLGADFIFLTYTTGGYAAWKKDVEICAKFGVLHSVGDTIGPAGLIRALRNVPVAVELAKEAEKVCPKAWIVNYSNPEGAICLGIARYTKANIFGLCHGTPNTVKQLAAEVFKVDYKRIQFKAAGINHLTFITELKIDGVDVYPKLKEKLIESKYNQIEPISFELYENFGLYPCPGDRHVEEFFPYYLKEKILHEKNYYWKNNDFVAVQSWRDEAEVFFLQKFNKQEKWVMSDLKPSTESIVHFIKALLGKAQCTEMANIINRGNISNVIDGIIVEIPVSVDKNGLQPEKIGNLPAAIVAKCDALGREYSLIVDAAVKKDWDMALQAFLLDPLIAHCDYPRDLFNALMEEYKTVL